MWDGRASVLRFWLPNKELYITLIPLLRAILSFADQNSNSNRVDDGLFSSSMMRIRNRMGGMFQFGRRLVKEEAFHSSDIVVDTAVSLDLNIGAQEFFEGNSDKVFRIKDTFQEATSAVLLEDDIAEWSS